ncbi:MAG: hypothetical protein AB1585_10665 [Thermodesulfobacteriota bacterium]
MELNTWLIEVYKEFEELELETMAWYQQDLAELVRLKNRFACQDLFFDCMDLIVYAEYTIGQLEAQIAETRQRRHGLEGIRGGGQGRLFDGDEITPGRGTDPGPPPAHPDHYPGGLDGGV